MKALVLIVMLTLLAGACCTLEYAHVELRRPPSPHTPELVAGVAHRDITPPPGLALFGHGPEGRIATGFLTRLGCQAFVLARGRENVALVTCDLAAPSLELQRAVANRVAALNIPIGAERILLMATHTHAAPAHYFGARNYAGPFGARLTGYDEDLVAWLAERIAGAIASAYQQRVRACAGWAIGRYRGLTRNRSYAAFSLNSGVVASVVDVLGEDAFIQQQVTPPPITDDYTKPPSFFAVDPTLSVLRIEDCRESQPQLIGAFAVFGLHPTVIPNSNDLYHGDVFGYAVREAQARLERECRGDQCPIVGIANGIEGDVSASWGYQGTREARRLGKLLGSKIVKEVGRAKPSPDFAVRAAYRELVWPCAKVNEKTPFWDELHEDQASPLCLLPTPGRDRLCRAPAIGTPASGGAEDGPTRLRAFSQMREGFASPAGRGRCHDTKHILMKPLGSHAPACEAAFEPGSDGLTLEFPALAPISVLELGGAVLVATPAELSTMVGLRMRERVSAYLTHLGDAQPPHVVITGLTNNWLQYVTTPEEYAAQHYEGASTLYGPSSEEFLSNHVVCLVNALFGDRQRDAECRMGQVTQIDTLYPSAFDPPRASRLPGGAAEPPAELVEHHDLEVKSSKFDGINAYAVSWEGIDPSDVRTARRLRIEIRVGDRVIADDDGDSLEVRHDDTAWTVRWFPELFDGPYCDATAYFYIRDHAERRSVPFTIMCNERQIAPKESAP